MPAENGFDAVEVTHRWDQLLESSRTPNLTNGDLHRLWLEVIRIRAGEAWPTTFRSDFRANFDGKDGLLHLGRFYPGDDRQRESSHFGFESDGGESTDLSLVRHERFPNQLRYKLYLSLAPQIFVLRGAPAFPTERPTQLSAAARLELAVGTWHGHKTSPQDIPQTRS